MVTISAAKLIRGIACWGVAPALLVAGLFLCVTPAHAQANAPVQDPLSIKIGALWPSNGRATYNGGSTQLSAGLDYAFGKTTQNNPALPSIYFDYNGGSRNGGHVDTYGLGVAIRAYMNTPSGANRQAMSPYYGAGIGVYDTDAKNSYYRFPRSGQTTSIGGKVFIGLEFSGNYFIEANYQWLPSEVGINPSGLGAQVGFRF